MERRTMRRTAALLTAVAWTLVAACDASEPDAGDEAGTLPPAGAEAGSPEGGAVDSGAAGAGDSAAASGEPNTVQVTLTDFDIEMPESLPPGRTIFRVTNAGSVPHDFEVENEQIEMRLPEALAPGESAELVMDLTPGQWEVYCPVDDHADRGMELRLTVQ